MADRLVLIETNLRRLLKDDPKIREQLHKLLDQAYESVLQRQCDSWGSLPDMPLSSDQLWQALLREAQCVGGKTSQ
ncbi:hypothetical protein HJO_07107 [Hyphomonas johnsonii MHS-2]|uniref:Uncharacterized protein n=1 Tax=Hyphomonas johnsonii MHS-2 TaxID=1280950 RepID=A0A059FQH2_9PROT|nr:hypothetical protein HJO_07107 [Hyphomonas johnsonii MHS-2]